MKNKAEQPGAENAMDANSKRSEVLWSSVGFQARLPFPLCISYCKLTTETKAMNIFTY